MKQATMLAVLLVSALGAVGCGEQLPDPAVAAAEVLETREKLCAKALELDASQPAVRAVLDACEATEPAHVIVKLYEAIQ